MSLCDANAAHMLSMIASIYGVFIYSIAFALEMWFIITNPSYSIEEYNFLTNEESTASIPVFAFILAAVYFITVIVSLLLMLGIIIKSLICLMTWIIAIVLLFFPECGLVLYMSLHKWGLERNGQIELCFYVVRGIMNVFFVVCVQNLLSQWKVQKQVSAYAMNISSFNDSSSTTNSMPYFDTDSTTINPVFKYTAAINATNLPTSEFDTRNFHELLYKKTYFEEPSHTTPYSTQSLDRKKLPKLKHSNSFKEEVILRPLYHQPFDYLQRPGSLLNLRDANEYSYTYSANPSRYRDYSDHKSSTQSIRDVAL
ncbi:hypothetical protein B4U79_00795 [Dinothrombium tinctorium]|uniref:Uncharacterized protein n=1 Tax=Dinothrombium tinctorium TaxID=1965070 RepID=A0A3S3PDA9_9ACAR|nr:hypothetical protein B4U79_00795 [Dinothrombium tinctorium]